MIKTGDLSRLLDGNWFATSHASEAVPGDIDHPASEVTHPSMTRIYALLMIAICPFPIEGCGERPAGMSDHGWAQRKSGNRAANRSRVSLSLGGEGWVILRLPE